MFKNYIKIAFRNLFKNKVFTLLNIFGLTVAFCVAILLAIGAYDTLGKDQFHTQKENLYQVYLTIQTIKGPQVGQSMPAPFAPTLKKEVPSVSKITRHYEDNLLATYNEKTLQLDVSYADAPFLEMFTFPVFKGEANPLKKITAVAITKKAAKLLLDTDDVIGKTIVLDIAGTAKPFVIAAVLEDLTSANSLNFQILVNFENSPNYKRNIDRWNASYHSVYLQLANNTSPAQFEESTRAFATKNYSGEDERLERDGVAKDANGQYRQLRLTPFVDRTFTTYKNGTIEADRIMPYLVLAIALLILFIASVNFINMTVAQGSKRLQEIGMRKTLGASKKQIFIQLWLESVFIFTISLTLGILLGNALLNEFQTLFRTAGSFTTLVKPNIILGVFLVLLSITLIAGGYPSYLLSKLGTLTALKGKMDISSGARLRNSLIVIQFGIAILLISGTIVLNSQIDFLRQKDLGFNKNNVVSIPFNGSLDSKTVLRRLRNQLENQPEILNITAADNNLGRGKDGSGYTSVSGFDYEGRSINTHILTIGYDYVETLGMEMVAGRSFSKDRASDSLAMVINETLAKEYGKENPLEISIPFNDNLRYNVIGVVKDYNFRNLKENVEPLTMYLNNNSDFLYAFVKVDAKNAIAAFDKIEAAWKSINPEATFLGTFLDENIDRTLRREKIMTTIITSGSIIAIILSCIGLFAISLLMVNQRTKEIGVRKIVGASVFGLASLLVKDFLKLVAIAFVIVTPIAWYMSFQWLQDYPYRISLNLGLFFLAGCIAVCIAMLTISFKTMQAALQNPVESLRSE